MALVMLIDLFSVPIVAVLATAYESGLYGWAMSIVGVPASLIFIALQVLQPAFARVDDTYAASVLAQSIRVVRSLSAIVVTPVVVAVPLLVYLVFPHVWLSAMPALMIMLTALVLQGATYAVVQYENARGSLQRISHWQRIAFAASIPFLLAGAALFGATGAACAYLLSRMLLAVPLHKAAKESGVYQLLPQAGLTIGIVGLASGIGFATTAQMHGVLELVTATIVATASVVALLWAQNHATAGEDARFIWKMLRRQEQPI
jgi:O-antigen/teichoic acid export membrane protein